MAIQRLQKVTIKDIARMCNVSTQTVSRVMNKRPDVSPDTREAVEKAINGSDIIGVFHYAGNSSFVSNSII